MLLSVLYTGDKPTIYQIVNMRGRDGRNLDIIGRIAAHNTPFGIQLLKDANGHRVAVITRNHINDGVEAITRAILGRWLNDGGSTCTYAYLIECIAAIRLGALAEEIQLAIANRTTGGGKPVHVHTCTQPESIYPNWR